MVGVHGSIGLFIEGQTWGGTWKYRSVYRGTDLGGYMEV